jgi:hypothetical protein
MNKSLVISDEILLSKIYFIRGKKVMLDRDLSVLYGVKTIRLREQVKRNFERFPEHFMFQLTEKEIDILVSQNAIPTKQHLGGYKPYAFTEHGLLMLANVLKSKKAIEVSIKIIEVFVKVRETLMLKKDVLLKLEKLERGVTDNKKDIKVIFTYLEELLNPPLPPRKQIGFKRKEEEK